MRIRQPTLLITIWLMLMPMLASAASRAADDGDQAVEVYSLPEKDVPIPAASNPPPAQVTRLPSLVLGGTGGQTADLAPMSSDTNRVLLHPDLPASLYLKTQRKLEFDFWFRPENWLALIRRWWMLLAAFFFLIRALWRRRREGDFGEHRIAFAIYLGLLGVLSLMVASGLGSEVLWFCILLGIQFYASLYTNPDLAEKRPILFLLMTLVVLAGAVGGSLAYHIGLRGMAVYAGCSLTASVPFYCLLRQLDRSISGALGGLFFDMIFAEGAFDEKYRKQRQLPQLTLLRHWREQGELKRAWHTARDNLLVEERAFPIWMFALETAIIHLHEPATAEHLLHRLIQSRGFTYDQQLLAVENLRDWMRAQGYALDTRQFAPKAHKLIRSRQPLAKARMLAAKGKFVQARFAYQAVLKDNPRDETALVELVRLQAQEMKDRAAAANTIRQFEDHHPPKLPSFLENSLSEWHQLPPRWQRRRLSDMLFRRRETAGPKPPVETMVVSPHGASGAETLENQVLSGPTRSAPTGIVSSGKDDYDSLIAEGRYGTVIEKMKRDLADHPENFELWMRYAEVHGRFCGNTKTVEHIIENMEQAGRFSAEQMREANAKLKEWQHQNAGHQAGW